MNQHVNPKRAAVNSQIVKNVSAVNIAAPAWNTPDNIKLLINNGYEPIPVAGKRAVEGWRTGDITPARFAADLAAHPDATDVGNRTGRVSVSDIDLWNPDHTAELKALAFEVLGKTDLERVGRKGAALVYRNETPIAKITIKGHLAGEKVCTLVEILGTGQQFVAYGIHADTGKPYTWTEDLCEPMFWPVEQLPGVTPQQLREFATKAAEKLTALGYLNVRVTGPGFETERKPSSPASGEPVSEKELTDRLAFIDPDVPYDEWAPWVGAIRASPLKDDTDESKRREIAHRWSRGEYDHLGRDGSLPANYVGKGAAEVDRVFDSMTRDADCRNFGSIDDAARKAGFVGPRAGQKKGSETFASHPSADDSGLVTRRGDIITPKKLEWLWRNRLPRGKCSLLAGLGDLGKTTVLLDITARITRGAEWPCGEGKAPQGSVLYLSAEDDPEDTIIPRLMAAGADLKYFHLIEGTRTEDGKGTKTFHLQEDIAKLERKLGQIGNVQVVIFDPISSYFGKTDTYRNSEVRGVLEPLVKLAARRGLTIIGNTHLAKGSKGRANMRVLDSVAMTNAMRGVYMVVEDADNPDRRLFIPSKKNLAPAGTRGLSFTLDAKIVDAAKDITGSFVTWGKDAVMMSADEALTAMDEKARGPTAGDEAKAFLREHLADGPKSSQDVYAAAKAHGHALITLRRAAKDLGTRSEKGKGNMHGQWVMSLPDDEWLT